MGLVSYPTFEKSFLSQVNDLFFIFVFRHLYADSEEDSRDCSQTINVNGSAILDWRRDMDAHLLDPCRTASFRECISW